MKKVKYLLEKFHRLLKTNFEEKHSWELSGKAYISEMEMRRKSFLTEKEYIQWFIYSFYESAGYTQNFKRPLLLLLILTFFVFPLLYSDLCFLFYDHCYWSWEPLRKSLDASLPIIKLSFEYRYWGIRYLQSFNSTIFLTFFILALRKRFKQ